MMLNEDRPVTIHVLFMWTGKSQVQIFRESLISLWSPDTENGNFRMEWNYIQINDNNYYCNKLRPTYDFKYINESYHVCRQT